MDASPDPTGEPAGASGGSAALALAVVAFATAMAYVEAAVVVDLRAALGVGSDALRLGHLPGTDHFVVIEFGRELATLVQEALRHGAALALPERVVLARPEGLEPPTL